MPNPTNNNPAAETETEDFNALFSEASALDDGDSYRDDTVQMGEAAEADPDPDPAEPVDDGMGDDDFYSTDEPLESPDEPVEADGEQSQATPEELKAQRRQDLLNRQRAIQREAARFQEEFGEPVVPKEVQERIAKGQQALDSVRQDLPEVLDAVEALVEERLGAVAEQTQESISASTLESKIDSHENAIMAAHPEYAQLRQDPQPVLDWIEALPAKYARVYLDAFGGVDANGMPYGGSPDEIIGLLDDFAAYPDPAEAVKALDAAMAGAGDPPAQRQVTQQTQRGGQRAPASNPRQANVPEAALAVRGRGTGRIPQASGAPATDDFDAAYKEWGAQEAQEARSA